MFDLKKDLSVLTNVKEYNLEHLIKSAIDIINYDVAENIAKRNPITTIDIGIGILYITNDNNTVEYKFIPSSNLEKAITDSYKGINQLKYKVDEQLGNRLNSTYKELF